MTYKTVLILFVLWLMPSMLFGAEPDGYVIKHEQMLYSVVLVDAGIGSGSGTVIYSGERDGEVHTYVLTNYHVIQSAITISEEWDPKKKEKLPVERRSIVEAYWFTYIGYATNTGKIGQRAEIVAYDTKADLALIRLLDTENKVESVTPLIPTDAKVHLMQKVWAIGSGLGYPPFATTGELASIDGRKDGYRYIMSTAPIVWGNSGGALFMWSDDRDRYELIGVPSKITMAGFRLPVFQMAWSVPAETIYEFLDNNCFEFITGNEMVDDCKEEEEEKAEDKK